MALNYLNTLEQNRKDEDQLLHDLVKQLDHRAAVLTYPYKLT